MQSLVKLSLIKKITGSSWLAKSFVLTFHFAEMFGCKAVLRSASPGRGTFTVNEFPSNRKIFQATWWKSLIKTARGFNQALMDLGSDISSLPVNPSTWRKPWMKLFYLRNDLDNLLLTNDVLVLRRGGIILKHSIHTMPILWMESSWYWIGTFTQKSIQLQNLSKNTSNWSNYPAALVLYFCAIAVFGGLKSIFQRFQ